MSDRTRTNYEVFVAQSTGVRDTLNWKTGTLRAVPEFCKVLGPKYWLDGPRSHGDIVTATFLCLQLALAVSNYYSQPQQYAASLALLCVYKS